MTTTPEALDPSNAEAMARAVARDAGVEIRLLDSLPDLGTLSRLLDSIWLVPRGGSPQIPLEQLRAMAHAGNYVAGAYAGKRLVAGSVGFFGAPADRSLHSHITGVAERARGRNVGYALKIHQRAWALSLGVDRVTWTFDPVIRRNAHFNLVKLGANPSEYFVNFYGDSDDVINAGQGSDRLLATWELASDHVHESLRSSTKTFRQPPPAMTVHAVRANGDVPVVIGSDQWGDASRVVVDTPRDIESLRGSDPSVALQWRMALRMVLADLIRDRATFLGLSSVGAYHFERNPR